MSRCNCRRQILVIPKLDFRSTVGGLHDLLGNRVCDLLFDSFDWRYLAFFNLKIYNFIREMCLCTLKCCCQLVAFTVECDELVTYGTNLDRSIRVGTFDSREWEPVYLLIEFFTVRGESTCIPGTTQKHTC